MASGPPAVRHGIGRLEADREPGAWMGEFVTFNADGSWSFHSCVVCGQELRSEASRERGYGPECSSRYSPAVLRLHVTNALNQDRWRRRLTAGRRRSLRAA